MSAQNIDIEQQESAETAISIDSEMITSFNTDKKSVLEFETSDIIANIENGNEPYIEPIKVSKVREIVSSKTLAIIIGDHKIPLYNHEKHDWSRIDGSYLHPPNKNDPITSYVIRLNKCFNLAVLDIDIDKNASEEDRMKVRAHILNKLSSLDIIELTTSGGLHVYCLLDNFPLYNRYGDLCNYGKIHTLIEGINVEVELLASHVSEKRQNVTCFGTYAINKRNEIEQYRFIRNNENTIIRRSMKDILDDLSLEYVPPEKSVKNYIDVRGSSIYSVSDTILEKLVDGIRPPIQIHNTTHPGNGMKNEASLMLVCKALNAIENGKLRQRAYDLVQECCTESALHNFSNVYDNFEYDRFNSVRMLEIMIEYHNPQYYNDVIKELKKQEFKDNFNPEITVNFDDDFSLNTIQRKSENNEYKNEFELAVDLTKVFCQIGERLRYGQKIKHEKIIQSYYIEEITRSDLETKLLDIKIHVDTGKTAKNGERIYKEKTGLQVFKEYKSHFVISPQSKLINRFVGYYYDPDYYINLPENVGKSITKIIQEIKENWLKEWLFEHGGRVLNDRFEQWLEDEKEKYRSVRKIGKLDVLFSIEEGTGKTIINKVMDELYRGHCICLAKLSSILDPKEMGNLKDKLRVHVQEWDILESDAEKNAAIKFLISGNETFSGRLLNQNMRDILNQADFYCETNHLMTGLVENETERRIRGSIVPSMNSKTSDEVREYFEHVMSKAQPEGDGTPYNTMFMYALSTYLYYSPQNTKYYPRGIPQLNKFAYTLLLAAQGGEIYYNFTCENINELINGIPAKLMEEKVKDYLKMNKVKVIKNKKEQFLTAITFIKTFNKCILKSRKITRDERILFPDVKPDTMFYKFDNIDEAKKYMDEDEITTYEIEKLSPEEYNKKIDKRIYELKQEIEEITKMKK